MGRIAVVTGGNSGLGLQTALALFKRGYTVYELSRREIQNPGLHHITADVTDPAQVQAAVDTILQAEGQIDVWVNNAGFGISGAVEFTKNADAKRLLDVNLFGAVNCIRAVVPVMRHQGQGRIVNISSVAAPVPIPFQAWYSVSKAAINALTQAVANELRPFGITVFGVMPGDIATGFTAAREKQDAGSDVYGGRIAQSVAVMEKDEQKGMDAAKAGRYIARLVKRGRSGALYTLGFSYQLVVFLIRRLPTGFANKIVGKLYKAI